MVKDWFPDTFRNQANYYASLYGAPIFLVGSSLIKETPRDIDIRVPLSDEELYRLYGYNREEKLGNLSDWNEWRWKQAADHVKRNRALRRWGGFPIDFQTQTMDEFLAHSHLPSIRLDTAPDYVLKAGING